MGTCFLAASSLCSLQVFFYAACGLAASGPKTQAKILGQRLHERQNMKLKNHGTARISRFHKIRR